MSSNVGLSTPRGSGTSGYVQRNLSHLKPRDAPYPPPSLSSDGEKGFKQRKPDQKILDHDRRRAIEVKVLEERDRLEEENEKIDEESEEGDNDVEGGEDEVKTKSSKRAKLSEDEIEERLDALRTRLLKELEEELAGKPNPGAPRGKDKWRPGADDRGPGPKGRKQFKSYQVHELAEAKIEESERLRKALGIKGDGDDDYRKGR